jgi:Uma2 family endonuclease
MYAVISREKIHLPPGTVVRMEGKTWQDYQALVAQLGDRVLPRIKYRSGEILLMAPMPKHGFDAALIADIAKVLLDHTGQDYLAYTPITMELPEEVGIEPDYCFYIQNSAAVIGKDRINWQTDPPPDLVIEIDVTSYTDIADYIPYEVPEIWLWKRSQLQIHRFQNGVYVLVEESQFFPHINVMEIISAAIANAKQTTASRLIRALRQDFPTNH